MKYWGGMGRPLREGKGWGGRGWPRAGGQGRGQEREEVHGKARLGGYWIFQLLLGWGSGPGQGWSTAPFLGLRKWPEQWR